MATYTFIGKALTGSDNWDDPSVWSGGMVPNAPDADVVFPTITNAATNQTYESDVTIKPGESYSAASVDVANNYLILDGSLSVAGAVDLNNGSLLVDTSGGTLSFGSLQTEGSEIQGSGTLASPGPVTNDGVIYGNGLVLRVGSFQNTGSLVAEGGPLTLEVTGGTGAFANLSDGTLTGGVYEAFDTLDLDGGGPIVTDAATLELNSPQAGINTLDPVTGDPVPLQQTLQTIAPSGILALAGTYATAGALTVDGNVVLEGNANVSSDTGTLSAASLTIGAGGGITGLGTIVGPVDNEGTIVSGLYGQYVGLSEDLEGTLLIQGAVTGSGSMMVGPGQPDQNSFNGDFVHANLELDGPTSENVGFTDPFGNLILDDPDSFTGTITPVAATTYSSEERETLTSRTYADSVQISDLSLASVTGTSYSGDADGGTLTIQEGAASQTLRFAGRFTADSFSLSAGPQPLSTSPPSLVITVAPTPPTVTAALADDTGASASDGVTSDDTLVGTADPNSTVVLTNGFVALGTTTTDADGRWSFDFGFLADGAHTVTVNESESPGSNDTAIGTTTVAFTLDTTPPTAKTVAATVLPGRCGHADRHPAADRCGLAGHGDHHRPADRWHGDAGRWHDRDQRGRGADRGATRGPRLHPRPGPVQRQLLPDLQRDRPGRQHRLQQRHSHRRGGRRQHGPRRHGRREHG